MPFMGGDEKESMLIDKEMSKEEKSHNKPKPAIIESLSFIDAEICK